MESLPITERDKVRLLNHVKRTRGQLAFIERELGLDHTQPDLLIQLAAVRGTLASLMAELLEVDIRGRVISGLGQSDERDFAVDLVNLVRVCKKK